MNKTIMKIAMVLCGVILAMSSCSFGTISVSAGDWDRQDAEIRVAFDRLPSGVSLLETTSGLPVPMPSQVIREDGTAQLYFILSGHTAAGQTRTFRICRGRKSSSPLMTAEDVGGSISLKSAGKDILTYNYSTTPAPDGVRAVYARSGYIHPANTPSGQVITNIQPSDHYHHYGIWNPWTQVEYDGRVYDLWNLGDSLGTVRAKEIIALYEGDVISGFSATLEHVAFTPGGALAIMDEEWRVKAVETPEGYLWDFTSILRPCTDKPLTIKAYRYQGFSIRATPEWRMEGTSMMTSEGLSRPDIDARTGRWIYVNGKGENVSSGILFLSAPSNFNAPEPMRIWKEGDVFVNFCPAKTKDWTLEPGRQYRLDYRVLVYDGEIVPEQAERLWSDFSNPPAVSCPLR